MPQLFLVMATQNPIEHEDTYPLPEAQMDRFLLKVLITYPAPASKAQMLRLLRRESEGAREQFDALSQNDIFAARDAVRCIARCRSRQMDRSGCESARRHRSRSREPRACLAR